MYSEDKMSIQAKEANIEQLGSISTFVIKIYNLLNVFNPDYLVAS